jgi:hypothetical protein
MEWQDYIKYIQSQLSATQKAFDPEKVKLGDIVEIIHVEHYGHHPACVQITKVNKKSWLAIEINSSYRSGTHWVISKDSTNLRMHKSMHLLLPEEVEVRGENQSFEAALGTKKDAENLVGEAVGKLRKHLDLDNATEKDQLYHLHQFIRDYVFDEDYGDEEDYRGAYYLVGLPEQDQLEMLKNALG